MPLIDLNTDQFPASSDVCIIGAGAAGITLAIELADAGLDVLLCDGGGSRFSEQSQDSYAGEWSGEEYYDLDTCRLRYFGGSTNHWAGYCHPLQQSDFAPRTDLPAPGWPISFADVQPYYSRAGEIATLPADTWNFSAIETAAKLPVLFDESSGMHASAFRWPRNANFRNEYFTKLTENPKVTVALNANFVDVDFGPSGTTVKSAHFRNYKDEMKTANAVKFVVSSGGIENAKLLLNLAENHSQLSQVAPRIGEFFIEHLCYYNSVFLLMGKSEMEYLKPAVGPQKLDGAQHQWVCYPTPEARAANGIAANVSIALDGTLFATPDDVLARPESQGVKELMKSLGVSGSDQAVYCMMRSEQLPNPRSRLQLTTQRDRQGLRRVALVWDFDKRDLDSIVSTAGLFAKEIAKKGLGRVYAKRPDGKSQWTTVYGGYHHMGTTRMSDSAAHGVVDTDCRVHGISNLYVGGSSIFSTGGWANPTINLMAFAVRLAEHLKAV